MDIPNIQQFSQQPGGGIVNVLRNINSLVNSNYQNQIAKSQAQYSPWTQYSNALSKMTYSNLMGPQYIAKLMSNPEFVANMKANPQKAADMLYKAGMMQTNTNPNNAMSMMPTPRQMQQGNGQSLGGRIVNWLKEIGGNNQNNIHNIQQGNVQPNNSLTSPSVSNGPSFPNTSSTSRTGWQTYPLGNQSLRNNIPVNNDNENNYPADNSSSNERYFQKSGKMKGIEAQEEEQGKSRAKAVSDLGDQYMQDSESIVPLNHLSQIAQSPVFMNMRSSIPFFQGLQLQTLGKLGNPEEQKMVGDFMTSAKTAVANTVNGFQGRAMAKEFDFANMLKVGDNDTLGVMLGKLESLLTFKNATMQRNRIASDLIENMHMNKGDAYSQANKQVNMDKIRDDISNQLSYPIKLINKKTGKSQFITMKQYNDLLKKQNK